MNSRLKRIKKYIYLITCSWTSSISDSKSLMNIGTAPASMTTLVWIDVPDAMLVKAHAASNYKTESHERLLFVMKKKRKKKYQVRQEIKTPMISPLHSFPHPNFINKCCFHTSLCY